MSESTEIVEPVVEPKTAVDLEAYERTKNHMHEYKRKLSEAEEKINQFQSQLSKIEDDKLLNTENYKSLWEKEKLQKEDVINKYTGLKTTIFNDKKMSAIKDHAMKSGFDPDFMDILEAFDTSDVVVEKTDSGKILVSGADTWVEALKSEKPKLFRQKVDPTINNSLNNGNEPREKFYTPQELVKLQKDDYAKYSEIITKKRHLIKTK